MRHKNLPYLSSWKEPWSRAIRDRLGSFGIREKNRIFPMGYHKMSKKSAPESPGPSPVQRYSIISRCLTCNPAQQIFGSNDGLLRRQFDTGKPESFPHKCWEMILGTQSRCTQIPVMNFSKTPGASVAIKKVKV